MTWPSGPFHTTEPKIVVISSENYFLSVLLRAQAQLAQQMDIRIREQAHEEPGEDQMGQRSINVLQMQCQDTDVLARDLSREDQKHAGKTQQVP